MYLKNVSTIIDNGFYLLLFKINIKNRKLKIKQISYRE